MRPAAATGESLEIRLHGRGGQGGVTCAKILAAFYARLGRSVQTFGDYAGERSGSPVRAYTRIADRPITNRNKVYEPDHVVVLDPTLLGADVLRGLKPGGILAVNSAAAPESLPGDLARFARATVDATAIARRHGIGSRTVVIVNTTMAGAVARVLDLPLRLVEETFEALGFASNLPAAREAFEAVRWRDAESPAGAETTAPPSPAPKAVVPLTDHRSSPPTGLATGSWRTQEPHYVENLAPCSGFCPAGNDVVGFVRALVTGGEDEAAEILSLTTPLPGVCGHVCPAPCMTACNRREYDGAVGIRGLERWTAGHAVAVPAPAIPRRNGRRIAIAGGGPAGIAAAQVVARAGHHAVVFEAEAALGGLLRTGIPSFRLPRDVVDREIAAVLELGVEARCGTRLGPEAVRALALEYDAVILATGLQTPRMLDVPGAGLPGVEQGLRFLRRVNVEGGVRCEGRVVVLGGGNTAIDCARSALRSGADGVTIAYRRTREEMPAIAEEVREAEDEGIVLRFQRAPAAVLGGSRIEAVELAEVEMGEPDATGRRSPRVTERIERLPADLLLVALGQSADDGILPAGWELRDGRFHDGRAPLNVFAAGDLATADGTVAHAIGSGRRAAGLALRALGVEVEVFTRPDRDTAVPVTDIRLDHFERVRPEVEAVEPPESRRRSFALVNRGLRGSLEAHRCFSCGHCTACDTCLVYCPEGIIRRLEGDYGVDYTYCKGCGICARECPRRGLEMRPL